MKKYIVALDEGTTSARAVVYDTELSKVVSVVGKKFAQSYPHFGWVEQDPDDIWAAQFSALGEAVAKAGATMHDVCALGITNQRETVVMWDEKTGKPVYPAIVWQCNRTADFCNELQNQGFYPTIKAKTGLKLDSYFSASKIRWILDNVPAARESLKNGTLRFGTVDTFLIWKLTQGKVHKTDMTNASRTLLFDINEKRWDGELLDIFGIPASILPEVEESCAFFGDCTIFDEKIPICAVAGDQQSALFGQECNGAGDAKNTYGTGCFMLMNVGDKKFDTDELLTTVSCSGGYVLEGSIFNAGSSVNWLADIGMIAKAEECETLARSVNDTKGVYFVPAFGGLGAPYWDMNAQGLLTGLTRGVGKAEIVRAVLESMAYSVKDVVLSMEKSGVSLKSLKVDGGVTNNAFLMQFQADILGVPVLKPSNVEATAMGAIRLAAKYCNIEIAPEKDFTVYVPMMPEERVEELYSGWKNAIKRSRA